MTDTHVPLTAVLHALGKQAYAEGSALPIQIQPEVAVLASAAGLDLRAIQHAVTQGWFDAAQKALQMSQVRQFAYVKYDNGRLS